MLTRSLPQIGFCHYMLETAGISSSDHLTEEYAHHFVTLFVSPALSPFEPATHDTKCPGWKRINSERYRLFEDPTKPALTEAQKTPAKKREELARVLKRLQAPGAEPRRGARELGKQCELLLRRCIAPQQSDHITVSA